MEISESSTNSSEIFKTLFTSYYKNLCNYAYLYLHDTEEAKEIVQVVFLKCWENASFDNPHIVLKSFLFASVKNACLDSIKHKMVRNKYKNMILMECSDQNEVTFESIIHNDLTAKINVAMRKLPPQCHKIFSMSRFKGLKNKVIAKELCVSVKAVEAQISKALVILRKELADYTS